MFPQKCLSVEDKRVDGRQWKWNAHAAQGALPEMLDKQIYREFMVSDVCVGTR